MEASHLKENVRQNKRFAWTTLFDRHVYRDERNTIRTSKQLAGPGGTMVSTVSEMTSVTYKGQLYVFAYYSHSIESAAYLENREGEARDRRAPLHPRRAPYGRPRHWRDFSEEFFGPSGILRPEKGLVVVVRAPSNYIFLVKTFAIGGRQTITIWRLRRPRGAMAQCPPRLRHCIQSGTTGPIETKTPPVDSAYALLSAVSKMVTSKGQLFSTFCSFGCKKP